MNKPSPRKEKCVESKELDLWSAKNLPLLAVPKWVRLRSLGRG